MSKEYYELIKHKVKIFIGKIDGDDINHIQYLIDDLVDDKFLSSDLHYITNAMWCEYGLDYGKTQEWDNTVIEILDFFKIGYNSDETDLENLIAIILKGIKKK